MLLIAFLFLFKNNSSSQNLVQNGSFESYTNINCSTGSYSVINNWNGLSSPDYFNSICSGTYGVPNNFFGVSPALNGNGYIGLLGYYKPSDVKEYIYQYLNLPLTSGEKYYISFYVSLADGSPYSIKNIGVNFTISQPTLIIPYISATPQVENKSSFLSDTTGWVKIEGYFTAQGGEQYMNIGNFNSNANTDTLKSGTLTPIPFEPDEAYYYIDSVSLYDSLTYVTNIKELKNEIDFSISPNPTNNICTINSNTIIQKTELTNITGQVLLSEIVNEKTHQLQLQNFAQGIYFIKVHYPNGLSITRKVIVNR